VTFPRFPDWLVYAAVAAAIIAGAMARYEGLDAPEPPPPVPGEEDQPLPSALPFDRAHVVRVRDGARVIGTAFSVSADGAWAASAAAVRSCRQPALVIAPGRAVEAGFALLDGGEVAVLQTPGGAPPIALSPRQPVRAGRGLFFAGYPQGRPGEAAARLIGRRAPHGLEALAYAETGRTAGILGALDGMAGAPALDAQGRASGVLISDEVRRGTLHATGPEPLQLAVAKARRTPASAARADPVTGANYYRVADELRRQLSIVPIVCLRR
jgi:hypothetical protein